MKLAVQVTAFAGLVAAARLKASTIVDLDTRYQKITGFGFSEAFGRSDDIYYLKEPQRQQVLDLLFSRKTGAGLNIVRNRIAEAGEGAIEVTEPASPNSTPTYVPLNDTQVWVSQQAMKYAVKTFYLDAWSPPPFMKTNNSTSNGGYLCGVKNATCDSGDWKQAYANYLVQNVKDWEAQGVPVTHLGFLNEPEFPAPYSSMLSNGTQAADFIKVLRPTINKAGLGGRVKLTCCDAEGWDYQKEMVAQIRAAGAESMLDVITSHWYVTQGTSPIDTPLPVWMTEYADLGSFSPAWYHNGSLNEGFTWANLIYQGLHDANLSAFLHWEGAENSTSGSTLVSVTGEASSPQVHPSGSLWAFGHYARYVQPGASRVEVTGAPSGFNMTAFQNTDNSVAVQLINGGISAKPVAVGTTGGKGFRASKAVAYVTDNANNKIASLKATLKDGVVSAKIPGRSLVTFVLTS